MSDYIIHELAPGHFGAYPNENYRPILYSGRSRDRAREAIDRWNTVQPLVSWEALDVIAASEGGEVVRQVTPGRGSCCVIMSRRMPGMESQRAVAHFICVAALAGVIPLDDESWDLCQQHISGQEQSPNILPLPMPALPSIAVVQLSLF